MPPRKQLSIVELMVIIAIVGILASILLPALKQAKDRSQQAPSPAAQRPVEPDGQLNTIAVSELSDSPDSSDPERWLGPLTSLVPIGMAAAIIAIIIISLRRQMPRRPNR